MDLIFKALNDPARRALLDHLRQQDGQSLTDLAAPLDMSRFGVMKHLGVLEDAGLITTVKRGRFKYHYLNAVPLQQVIDRWIEPLLAKPATRRLLALKSDLEGASAMTDDQKPDFVLQTFIRCTPDALWRALSDPEQMAQYHFMADEVVLDNSTILTYRNGQLLLTCRELTVDREAGRVVTTFEPHWDPQAVPSRVVYIVRQEGDNCCLTVEHYGLQHGSEGVANGWARMMAGLKTWLETGTPARFEMTEPA